MLHRIKKQNDMNGGKWIGVGGHVESQETPEECLMREVKEETGLTLTSYKFRGLVTFVNNEYESELMCVFHDGADAAGICGESEDEAGNPDSGTDTGRNCVVAYHTLGDSVLPASCTENKHISDACDPCWNL